MHPVADWSAVWIAADFKYDPQTDPKAGERYLSYFPVVEPWTFLVVTLFLLSFAAFCFSSLFLWPLPRLVQVLPARIKNVVRIMSTHPPVLRALIAAILAAATLYIT